MSDKECKGSDNCKNDCMDGLESAAAERQGLDLRLEEVEDKCLMLEAATERQDALLAEMTNRIARLSVQLSNTRQNLDWAFRMIIKDKGEKAHLAPLGIGGDRSEIPRPE